MKNDLKPAFLALTLFFLTSAGFGQTRPKNPTPPLWGKTLPAQPFDTQPFHEIAVPDWLEETTRVTYCFSVMSAAMRDRATLAGSQISEMGFVSPFAANYPSSILKKRDSNLPPDYIDKEIADYKRRHVRILAVVPPGLLGEIYAAHPDWRRVYTDTHIVPQVDMAANPIGGPLCLLGPWGDRLIDVLAEVLTQYPDVDAFSFDGLHDSGYCYCEHCRENYRKEIGQEIPPVNMNDLAFRRYLLWEDRRLEAIIERMQTRLKAIKPTVALLTWTTNAGRFGHFLDIPRNMSARMNTLLDAPDQEFWMDESNRGNTLVPAFANAVIWAMSDHRVAFSSPYLFSHGNPYGPDSFPPQEVLRRILLAMTYGARPSMALAQPATLQNATYESLHEIARREPWITHVQPEPWAALLLSDTTRVFYGRESGRVEDRYLANVLGAFRTGVEEHLPVTVINEWNLNADDLSRYKVLILPNTACLSAAQAQTIREFVQKGGGLVATLDSSHCDEMGEPRKDFALADVFGVHYRGIPQGEGSKTDALDVNFLKGLDASYWEKRKNIYDFRMAANTSKEPQGADPRLRAYIGDEPVTFKGQAVAVGDISADARTIGTFGVRSAPGALLPAIVTHSYGKGHVVYMAAGFDAAYYLYAYPYQRLLLAQAIRQVASTPFGIAVEAPMCVHATYFRQNKANRTSQTRLVVHLYNDLNSTGGHGKPDDDVPLREEIVPIHDIRVRFTGYNITKVHLEPEGQPLLMKRTKTGIEVVVPALNIHSMVVAELAP
ncbi:MAG: Beta-galactosidase trimerization domain protein [Chthonomonadaceae bacterium]|nr:Beta-galactosidase trimerization domain protein [Chthonomonadaceae bacterium]